MHARELSTSQNGRRRWTSGVVAAIALASVSLSVAGAIWHAPTVYASQYSSAVLADSPSDYWPADEGSGTAVNESPTVGSRNLAFDSALSWFGSGMVTGSNSAIQGGCVTPCPRAWLTGVPAPLPATRSEEIWFRSASGSVTSVQGLISVRQPENGSGGCSEGHTDVLLEPNPAIRVDSIDCNVGEFATDCTFGQNGIPNLLDQQPHLIDVTENNGTVTVYIDAHVCATGSGANVAISSPDCVAVGATECTNGTFPLAPESVIGQAALYPTALTVAQISNHFSSGHAVAAPLAVYAQALSASSGKSFSGLVATFTDPSPSTNPSDYTSNIDWGDGTNNAGSIVLNSTGGIINGSHTYAGAGLFTIRVTVTKVGSTPVVGSNVARVTTHYQVMIQGWIPQPLVVYPILPVEGLSYLFLPVILDGNCITINDANTAAATTVTTLNNGNDHTAFQTAKGSYKVMGSLDFDWDGVSIKNPIVARGEGTSQKIKLYWINGRGPVRCQVEQTQSDADTTAHVTGPNTFSVNIGLKAGKNPFTPEAVTPAIVNGVIGTVNSDGSLKLFYATTGFPSLAIQITRNGVVADTDITNDVSCLSNSDVRGPGGAAILATGLSFPWNSGTEIVPANAVGLSRTNYGWACVFRDIAKSQAIGGASVAPAAPPGTSISHRVSLTAQSTGVGSAATAGGSSFGAISGRVTDSAGISLPKICVRATGPFASAATATATTGSSGTYTLASLPAGTYDVSFQECGGGAHVTQWFDGKPTQGNADLVPVSAGLTTAFVNASLSLASSITGTIRNQASAKLAGICAHAEDAAGHFADALASTSTGAYHLGGLPAGSYRLTFSDCSNGDYLVNTPAALVNITSTVGTITLDATMTLGGRITGTITDASGHALSNVCPVAFTTGGTVAGLGSTTSSYTIHALAPGAFKVRFADCTSGIHVAQYWNNKPSFATATLVNVTAGAATPNVNARMATGGTVTGTIRDAAGAALAGACAMAQSATGGESTGTSPITTTSGAYTISGLATDQYAVELFDCTGGNHLPRWFNNKPDAGSADQVHVVAGSATTGINGSLPTGAALSGHVTASGGGALANVCVTAYDTDKNPVASATSDSTGAYNLGGIAGGSYRVEFADCFGNAHTPQWYSNKPDFASATPLQLTLGLTATSIDAALTSPGSITGQVTDTASHGLQGICVNARPTGSGSGSAATTDSLGRYTVGLGPGSYVVAFTDCVGHQYIPQWFGSGSPDLATAQPVTVAAGNATPGINAALAVGGSISGAITGSTGSPISGACVKAIPLSSAAGSGQLAVTDANGLYTLGGLPTATYAVQVADCTSSGRISPAVASSVQVVAPSAVTGINGQLVAAASIAGIVTDSASASALPGVCVDAYPGTSTAPVAEALTGSDGRYQIGQLVAGSYFVQFTDCTAGTHASQWATNKPDQASATQISLATGGAATGVSAALQPTGALSVADVTVTRPASGSGTATFVVSLAAPMSSPVSVDVTTADGTALAQNGDYVPIPVTTLTFQPGETAKNVDVIIPGRAGPAPSLTFTLSLTNPVNAALVRASATGTIVSP